MVCWNPSSGDWLENSIPDIGTKEGGRNVSVLKIQDRSGEGLEFGGGICWKVDELRGRESGQPGHENRVPEG